MTNQRNELYRFMIFFFDKNIKDLKKQFKTNYFLTSSFEYLANLLRYGDLYFDNFY